MPKGLVVYLDDETYKRFKMLCVNEGNSLKDQAYELIKETVESYEEFMEEQREKQREALSRGINMKDERIRII